MIKSVFVSLQLLVCLTQLACQPSSQPVEASSIDPQHFKTLSKLEKMEVVQSGKQLPVANIYTSDSSAISTSFWKGNLLVIDFWASWCSPCLQATPKFHALSDQYPQDQLSFISISVDDSHNEWKAFLKENKWKGNNYWLGSNENQALFSFTYSQLEIDSTQMVLIALPKYVFISPSGEILGQQSTGPGHPEFDQQLKRYIDKYL